MCIRDSVTIDLDPTDDPTHGAQQLSFFNGHYDTWCYLPVMGFVSFNDEAEQYLCAAVLRPGNVGAAVGAVGLLRRLVRMIPVSYTHLVPSCTRWSVSVTSVTPCGTLVRRRRRRNAPDLSLIHI